MLSWAQALVISTPDTWCIVVVDLNRNPGWVAGLPHALPDPSDLFNQFALDASLTRAEFMSVSPTCVGSQGWSNVLDYIQVRVPIAPPQAFIHTSSSFPSDHSPISLSLSLYLCGATNKNMSCGKRSDATMFPKRFAPRCVNVSIYALLSKSHLTGKITPPPKFFGSYNRAFYIHRRQF